MYRNGNISSLEQLGSSLMYPSGLVALTRFDASPLLMSWLRNGGLDRIRLIDDDSSSLFRFDSTNLHKSRERWILLLDDLPLSPSSKKNNRDKVGRKTGEGKCRGMNNSGTGIMVWEELKSRAKRSNGGEGRVSNAGNVERIVERVGKWVSVFAINGNAFST